MSYSRANFFWIELLSKVMTIPFLIVLILLLTAQTTRMRADVSPKAPVELPAPGNLKEVLFYQ